MAAERTIQLVDEAQSAHAEPLAHLIESAIGQNAFLCNQCARCSSGCPVVEHMDRTPSQVIRSIQLDEKSVLESTAIWLCASCQTCTARCPQGIDVAGIMDQLKIEARAQGIAPSVPTVDLFNRLFLGNVKLFGRLYELGLMASMNVLTGKPFNSLAMGVGMVKRNKLVFTPKVTSPPKKVQPVAVKENTVAYYPGCSLHSTAREYDHSIRAVAGSLGLELIEPPGWTCCGSSPAHSSNHELATLLPVRNLSVVERMGLDTVTAPCSACYARLIAANHAVAQDPQDAHRFGVESGDDYRGSVKVKNLVETLIERAGPEKIAASTQRPLTGLKVACYYGCLMTRPPQLTKAENPEYPMQMERLLSALGAEPIDWSYKTDCCGGSLGLTQTPVALEMTRKILENAHDCGADLVITVCPLCHVNLDARQSEIRLDFDIPVLYLTQLMSWAFGHGEKQAGLDKNFVDARPILLRSGAKEHLDDGQPQCSRAQ